jgi:hypothetical protein
MALDDRELVKAMNDKWEDNLSSEFFIGSFLLPCRVTLFCDSDLAEGHSPRKKKNFLLTAYT